MNTSSEHNDLFDICIVGAGMAGATIAAYLAPRGIKIALIDCRRVTTARSGTNSKENGLSALA